MMEPSVDDWLDGLEASASSYFLHEVDAETGLVYLRARYYDPSTGQFLSRDPIEDQTLAP